MTQLEFALLYVALPLAVALGWLFYRARGFLRNAILYALAVVGLLAMIRLGDGAWTIWHRWTRADQPAAYPFCIDLRARITGPRGSCWL